MITEADILAFLAVTQDWYSPQDIGKAFRTQGRRVTPHLQALKRNKLVVEVRAEWAITARGVAAIPPGLTYAMPVKKAKITAIEHRAKLIGERKARESTFLARLAQHEDFLNSDQLAELTSDLWDCRQRPRDILHKLKDEGKAEIRIGGNRGNLFRLTKEGREAFKC